MKTFNSQVFQISILISILGHTHSGILVHPQFPLAWNSFPNSALFEPPPPPECARIWDAQGVVHFHLNQNIEPLEDGFHFVPTAVEVRERTVLVIIDIFHKISVYTETVAPLPLGQCPIRFASCESCLGKGPSGQDGDSSGNSSICAILYEAPFCATALERAYEVLEGEEEVGTGFELKGVISSVMVRDGCVMEIYSEEGFSGNVASVNGTLHRLDWDWDNQIASFKCGCGEKSTETPTTTTPKVTDKPETNSTTPMTPDPVVSPETPKSTPIPTPEPTSMETPSHETDSTTPDTETTPTTPQPTTTTDRFTIY